MAALEGAYIHGVRADVAHWTDAWNFSLAGTRSSVGLINTTESHATPYDVDLDVLHGPPQGWPPMFLSGFLATLWIGGVVRAGGRVGRGVNAYPTQWATEESQQRALHAADRELALEEGRRIHAPDAPSRLCCIWLAETSPSAVAWVQQMVGLESFIMKVKVSVEIASFRCDAHWLDRVHLDPADRGAIAGYWSGASCPGDEPLWEYLLEGQIAAADEEELERLRTFIRTQGPPADLLGPPPSQRASTA